jgi:hypothetical protein
MSVQILLDRYFDQQALENDSKANLGRPFQQCSVSVLDTIADPNIAFDANGVSHYRDEYLQAEKKFVLKGAEGRNKLHSIAEKIREGGKGKTYDCILGLSGGVDSTYRAFR